MVRRCSRSGCSRPAVATLTFAYADSTAVLGPLSTQPEPGCYDLCAEHAAGLVAPRGWELIRLPELASHPPEPDDDDLLALAKAVREIGLAGESVPPPMDPIQSPVVELARRGHLRVIADADHRQPEHKGATVRRNHER